jgi:hypothetical protein
MKTKQTIRQRTGTSLVSVTVETEPAIIEFSALLDAVKYVPDDHCNAP